MVAGIIRGTTVDAVGTESNLGERPVDHTTIPHDSSDPSLSDTLVGPTP